MLNKLKANLSYIVCAFLGMFHFVMLAFNYLSAYVRFEGKRESEGFCNGYEMLKFADFDGSKAEALTVINGILQILLIVVAVALLAIGVMGILKAFGVFKQFPDKLGNLETKNIAVLGLLGYVAITLLLFVLMLIWSGVNAQEMFGYKVGFTAGFGIWFALFFGAALAAAPIVLPKFVPFFQETSGVQVTYHCEKCGKKAGKNEKFCNDCGGAVVAEVVKQYTYVCSGCGKKMKKTDKFCNACGGAVVEREVALDIPETAPADSDTAL